MPRPPHRVLDRARSVSFPRSPREVRRARRRGAARAGPGGAGLLSARRGLEVRSAARADAPGLAALLAAGGIAAEPGALAERLDALRLEGGTALVSLDHGPPNGLVVLHRLRVLDAPAPVAVLSLLLVAPEERRRGLGRVLLKAASQAARAGGCAALHVVAAGEEGVAFLRATGFAEDGTGFVRGLRKRA